MNFIKKIQLAAKQNNFEVIVSGDKRKLKYWNAAAHKGQYGLPYKAIVSNDTKMFRKLCSHLVRLKNGTEGYYFECRGAGVAYWCKFIDGDFTYVVSKNGTGNMILAYKKQ